MRKTFIISVILALFAMPLSAFADISVTFHKVGGEKAIELLEKATGYDFVAQKETVNSVKKKLEGTFSAANLHGLLDKVICTQMGLSYEIVDKTVIISPVDKNSTSYVNKKINGVVFDENDEPLAGAFVYVEGTTIGGATNVDGEFSLSVDGLNPTIVVNYIGMKPASVRLNAKTPLPLQIKLENNYALMDEVVVTGYQTLKRENATGAFQTITSEDMENRVANSIVDQLEGQVPGLVAYTTNGSGKKGEDNITIRGVGSLNAKTSPLIVVDGLPIEGGIETVNPYDIQNITVLKDAAAASIYGARASNGVIVITTKTAKSEKVSIDFNADWTISNKQNYDIFNWMNSAELLEFTTLNFNSQRDNADKNVFNQWLDKYNNGLTSGWSLARRLLFDNYAGKISDAELKSKFDQMSKNDYRKEYQDAWEKKHFVQQYNVAMRVQGKKLASSIMVNFKRDNQAAYHERNDALTLKYKGDLNVSKILDLSFGLNIINERAKNHIAGDWNAADGMNTFEPYWSMYNADGSLANMELEVPLDNPALSNPAYELKDASYNPITERNKNWDRTRRTNIRAYLQGIVKLLPGWTAQGHFQYEDIYYKSEKYFEPDSYSMRTLFNRYTEGGMMAVRDYIDYFDDTIDWDNFDWDSVKYDENWDMYTEHMEFKPTKHYIPDGGMLKMNTAEGSYWTFRAQTQYNNKLWGKHDIDAVAGFEFRSTRDRITNNLYMGYDDQAQTNNNGNMNWAQINSLFGNNSVLGEDYSMFGAPSPKDGIFDTSDILHRFYSVYFNANYVYDTRYAVSGSWRIDKTDLFGADPKFRGRPLWSVGASWNAHNETFLRDVKWISALKPRFSYGITGNINSNVSSYLTATIGTRWLAGDKSATIDTAPNDQLRWEKTATTNFGLDFAFFNYRLSGSVDYYQKHGSDLLTLTDLDPTTGWTSLNINNGKMNNKGIELQLNGQILEAKRRNQVGINATFNLSYNKNKITQVNHEVTNGMTSMSYYTFHQGYPIHSLFSWRYAGMEREGNNFFVSWKDNDGNVHKGDPTYDPDFTPEQTVYCGQLDPKIVMGFMPEISYQGFTLSAMMSYYGGHVMRYDDGSWSSSVSSSSTKNQLEYFRKGEPADMVPTGYLAANINCLYKEYRDTNVLPADYLKLRNIVLSYSFPRQIVKKMGMNDLRLRFQMNNVATWAKNKYNLDPEAISAFYGSVAGKTPKSYSFSLFFNL